MTAWRDPRDPAADDPELPRWIFLHALRVTIGRTPVWLVAAGLLALLALVLSAPWFSYYDEQIGKGYEPGSLVALLDESFRFDHRAERQTLEAATRTLGGVLALAAMIAGAFTAGGWLQVFLEHTQGESVRRFFYGGSRFFWRFVRVAVLTLLLLQLLGWLIYGRPWEWLVLEKICGLPGADLHALESELSARKLTLTQDALFAIGFTLVLVWGDYTRTRLAAHGTRSAIWAGLCSVTLLVAHPIRSLRPLGLLWAIELAVLAIGWGLTGAVQDSLGPGSSRAPIAALFAIGVGVYLWRAITRGARYAACVLVTRDQVRPLARPDPWKHAIGGPGGPRYPIDGDDYGVAL
jgi:hypothetical protein